MKNALVIQNWTMMVVFALLIGIIGLVASVRSIDPLQSEHALIAKTSNSIVLNIGSLVSLAEDDEGTIEITMDDKIDQTIRVSFQTRGDKGGYTIREDGWYVITSAGRVGRQIYSVSRIHAFPPVLREDMRDLVVEINSPKKVCVVKEKGKKYPKVKEWLTVC